MDLYFSQKPQFKIKNILMMNLFHKHKQLSTSQDVNWLTGVVWIIVMFLSALWTLILMAPIHLFTNFSKSVLMKKQTHLHLGSPDGEYIFSQLSFLGELFLKYIYRKQAL